LRLENQAASSSLQNTPAVLFEASNNALPRSECEEKCARLKAELEEMKREKNEEVRNLRDELKKMEDRKDYYKNNFSQAEDRANDEEQEYRAEAEAFEKLRNEYNTNVIELENLEKDKLRSSVSQREAEKINLQPSTMAQNNRAFFLERKCSS
jgi:seryl-tRNA synthetase